MQYFILFSTLLVFFTQLEGSKPSSLDTSFNETGSSTNLFLSYTINQAEGVIAQPDGKTVTTGSAGDNAITVRYNENGTLDTSFNGSGTIITTLGTKTAAHGIALQPLDQKIIIVGYTTINNIDNTFIARYNTDGSLDTSFNFTGYITTTFGLQSQLFGIALQPNGNIVVTGSTIINGFTNALIARYTSAGILDTSFNTTGYVTTLIGDVFTKSRTIKIQLDGKIIIAGQSQVDNNQGIILLRYTTDGTLDTTFNNSGTTPGTASPFSSYLSSEAYDLAIHADQRIVVVGKTNQTQIGLENQSYTIARFNTDGTLDTTFNSTGYSLSNIGLQANGVVIENDQKIVVCGFNYTTIYTLVVNRYNENGTVDPTFNFTEQINTENTIGNGIDIQLDGKIIVTGTIAVPYQS